MDEPIIEVDGVPFALGNNQDGYYITATSQEVDVVSSPLIISFNPPIAPTVDCGEIYQAIKAQLPYKGPPLP